MKKRLFLALLAVLVSGCASTPKPARFYEGSPLPIEQVARVRMPNVRIWVVAVDGKSTRDWQGALLDKSEIQLLPGQHELSLLHTRNDSWLTHDRAESTLSINVRPGHFYTVTYNDVAERRVEFVLRDHGSTYNEKCARLLTEMSMNIYLGTNVPAQCR